MNRLQKRKKLLESFSRFGINECCCECDPTQGRILASNLNSPDGTLDLTPYKKSGEMFQKRGIRYFFWHANWGLYNDIISGELIDLPDTFNLGNFANLDYAKKIYFELVIGCKNTTSSSQARFPTCVPTQFNVPNFYESGNDDINAFLNRDFTRTLALPNIQHLQEISILDAMVLLCGIIRKNILPLVLITFFTTLKIQDLNVIFE